MALFRRIIIITLLALYSYNPITVLASQKVDIESLREKLVNSTVTVSDSATPLPATALKGRKSIIIINISTNNIFIGDSSVTTSNGLQLIQNQGVALDITDDIVVYGIAASGSNDVRVLEVR